MKHEVKLKPFQIPEAVQLDVIGTASVPLRAVSDEALAQLCEQFRRDAYRMAGKLMPPEVA